MKAIDSTTLKPRPALSRRQLLMILGAVAVIGVVAAVFVMRPKAAPEESAAREGQLVTAVEVDMREFVRTAPVSGEARPVRDVRVFAPAAGVRIEEVLVEIGDVVEAGQPLARLDADVVDAQVKEAEAAVRQAAAEELRATEQWSRVSPNADDPAFSREEIQQWRAAAEAASAELAAKKAALAQVKARMQGGYVRAPAAGLVIERNANVGEYADQQALFRIVGGNRLEVAANVSESDMRSLEEGQKATFVASNGAVVEGTLRVPPVAVDQETRTGVALFDLPEVAPVRAGMYLRGDVIVEKTTALAVPRAAVSYAAGKPGVFVIDDGKAHLREVKLGATTGDYIAVVSGLREGETVAAAGGAFIMDGDPVRTTSASTPGGSAAAGG